MITATQSVIGMINSPVRKITAKVEVYEASTLVDTFAYDDKLISLSIERACEEGKFFGFGICQKVNIKLLDVEREIDYLTTKHSLRIAFGANGEYTYTSPTFYITQTRRDENTNELTIYGYDLIYDAAARFTSEVNITAPYSALDYATVCAVLLGTSGVTFRGLGVDETCHTNVYGEGANFEGTESVREALDSIAEITQTIYYLDVNDTLVFKRLDKDGYADLAITKDKYISLESKESRRLATICHTTELADNIAASIPESGSTQYIRDNAFWTMLDSTDISGLIDEAVATVGGLTINQFTCSWRGDFLLEIGDKISLTTKDGKTVMSFVLDDMIEYNGGFSETTKWSYTDDDTETAYHATTLGDVLKYTYAKVNKVDKNIELVVSDIAADQKRIAALEVNTDSINASVEQVINNTNNSLESVNESIAELTNRVQGSITSEEVSIKIQEALSNGSESVTTQTGFTFNEDGLKISKSDSEMSTEVTEDGMTVYKGDEAVLIANNEGVDAKNLHATTYLIIGSNSRFEDYTKDGEQRTGCFWLW